LLPSENNHAPDTSANLSDQVQQQASKFLRSYTSQTQTTNSKRSGEYETGDVSLASCSSQQNNSKQLSKVKRQSDNASGASIQKTVFNSQRKSTKSIATLSQPPDKTPLQPKSLKQKVLHKSTSKVSKTN